MNHVFPYHQLDFVNLASRSIIMEICKEFRVEWESVVLFGMNENVGEERGEKEERAEEWWWWGVVWCGSVRGVVCVWCGVVCCGVVVCVCMLRNKFLSRVCTQPWPCVVIRKGTAKSGACDVIRFNTGKLTIF